LANETFSVLLPQTMPVWSHDPVEQAYHSDYVAAGVEAIQRRWLSRGCPEDVDEVIRIARTILMGHTPAE